MKLRLVTYNIHRAIGVDRRFRPERIVEILKAHDADLVLLQEVDDGVPRSRRLDLAKTLAQALDYPFRAVGHNVQLSEGRYGNATLSRFPILRQRNIDLSIARKKRRGCQYTSLEIPLTKNRTLPLEVFNLHLGLSAAERLRQVQLLASSPELRRLAPKDACIVAGDFNDWRSLLRPHFLDSLGFSCATDHLTRRGTRALKTYPAFSPRGGLDRVYFRGPLEIRKAYRCRHQISKIASDHLPVIADFVVTEKDLRRSSRKRKAALESGGDGTC